MQVTLRLLALAFAFLLSASAWASATATATSPALTPVVALVTLTDRASASAYTHTDKAVDSNPSAPVFVMVSKGVAAQIVLPADAPEVVRIAANDLAKDITTVTGVTPKVSTTVNAAAGASFNAAPATAMPRIELVFAPDLAGRWEAFRISASSEVLTIAGADRRGLAYGIYEVSRRIGVSPWSWWADVPVTHRDELTFTTGVDPVDAPAVKYRGIFLNDEGWGLVPWASKTFEPEVGNLGPKTYSRIFELLLRLRANSIWPAMHPGTTPFHKVPGNAAAADRYAIVVGSSHAEPMLRNNVGEWTEEKDRYNYVTNRDGVFNYWEQRVKERTSGESLFTLGMRGIHDSAIVGPKTQPERIATVEKIIADQRGLLARYLGQGDPTRVAQIFVPYKEVLEDYNAGLRVPDDVTLVWPDDNFGYIRRFATDAERKRSGGLGVYYHLSYLGAPLSWLWIDSLPQALVWTEMMRAYEHGAKTFWVANVGDLKANELSTEFFLDLAWHADRTGPDAPANYLRARATRDFGALNANSIAAIWAQHQHLASARKPEHLQWNLPTTPYKPTEFTGEEITQRLAAYKALADQTDAVARSLPADAQDAFFQLVSYPVNASAAANERYFRAELARLEKARGETAAASATFALSIVAEQRVAALTRRYNEDIAGGKWKNVIMVNGVSTQMWKKYQPDPEIPPLDSAETKSVNVSNSSKGESSTKKTGTAARTIPSKPTTSPVAPASAKPGDFVERDRVISINAGHFTSQKDTAGGGSGEAGGGWRSVEGLGRTGSAVTVLPSMLAIDSASGTASASAPRLSYSFHVVTGGAATLRVRLLPTHPIVSGQGLRLAIAIDNGPAIPLAVKNGFDPKSEGWKQRVLSNATEAVATLPSPLSKGAHSLDLIAVDTGVVVDKIVIDLGGLQPSYDGPAETRLP